ncbi:MAG: LysR family transcriptional regulator [Myxococcota bacterium]
MDWDDLRYVLALTRAPTLARAAKELGVTHTTVGRRLRRIASTLGVRLFDRTPEGLVPTVAGRDLSEVAEQIEGDVHAAEGRMLGRDTRLDGPLRVSTMDLFFCNLHDAFASFVERYPEVDLAVDTSLDRVSLTRREADVVLRLTNQPPEYLVGRKVGRMQFAVYAADALVARVGEEAPLEAYPWLGWGEGPAAAWLDRWLETHAPGGEYVLRLDENARARECALRAGTGVGLFACIEGDAWPGVRRISAIFEEHAHDVWLLTLRELRSTTRVRAFMDHMAEAFTHAAPRLAGVGRSE